MRYDGGLMATFVGSLQRQGICITAYDLILGLVLEVYRKLFRV